MYAPGVPQAEKQPGHREVLPQGSESSRGAQTPAPEPDPESGHESSTGSTTVLGTVWVLALLSLTAVLVALRTLDGPRLAEQSCAAALGVLLTVGLTARAGGQVRVATALALAVAVAAVATQWAPLLAGAALATGVVAASLAVLATRPAPSCLRVVLEVVVATLVAGVGGVAVTGFSVSLDSERLTYSVLVVALVGTLGSVHRIAGGLHGLGRRGLVLVAGALALLVVVLVYTAALTRYGSPELVDQVRSAQDWTREHLGGVPHPIEVLVGVPALAWGVSLRSRRRQGWWACAFGTAATAHLTSDLLGSDDTVLSSGLGALYGLGLGLVLGAVVIRLEGLVTGGGRRRKEQLSEPRSEPPRLRALH